MSSGGIQEKWRKYFHTVAYNRLSIELIREDIEFEKNGGRIFYAIDTNVVYLYADPLEYKIFAPTFDEDEKVLEASVISLADFIFVNGLLSDQSNALLLPTSLREEFIKCWHKFVNRAINENYHSQDVIEKINALIAKITKSPNNEKAKNDLVDYLINKCPNLVRYLHKDGRTPAPAIERLDKLISDGKILPIESSSELDFDPDIATVESLADRWNEKMEHYIKEKLLAFKKDKNIKIDLQLIGNDTKALAQIALINGNLIAENKPARLYYLSADDTIHKFVRFNELNTADNTIKNAVANLLGLGTKEEVYLKRNYFRHPAQYVNCIRFTNTNTLNDKHELLDAIQKPIDDFLKPFWSLKTTNENELDFLQNLCTLFNPETNEKTNETENFKIKVQKVIDAFVEADPKAEKYEKLKKEQTELLALRNITKALNISNLAKGLSLELNKVGLIELLNKRRKDTYDKVSKTSHTFGIIGLTADYFQQINIHTTARYKMLGSAPRGPVSLKRSTDNINGEQFFEKIHELVSDKNWSELFNYINDQSAYIKHLIYALLAADAGHWRQARNCCEDAIKAAEDNRKVNEGLYFLAVAIRHDCQDPQDYETANQKREEGLNIWKARHNGRDDLRFESERLSLATAYFNYKQFNNWRPIEHEPEIRKTWEDLLELERKLASGTIDEPPYIVERIKRQLYSNLCCLFIFDEQFEPNNTRAIENNEGRMAFEKLLGLSRQVGFKKSYFIEFLLAYLAWYFAKNRQEKIRLWKVAYDKTNAALKAYTIPYEEEKFQYYANYLEEHKNDLN